MNGATTNFPALALANALMVDAMRAATTAVYHLEECGATVREIVIRGRRPLIRIERPPSGSWLHGALRRRITERGVTRTVYATTCHGTVVEWEVSQHHAPAVARA